MQRVVLIVMDGWGISTKRKGNCIYLAKPKHYRHFINSYPHTELCASGLCVGLPKNSQGNSEVGHLHLGAGRIVLQPLEKINRAIKNGEFFRNKAFLKAINFVKRNKSKLHLMGLCSDEGVHAHINHLLALMELAAKHRITFYVHFFADGRDVPERSALKYVRIIERKIKKLKRGKIASIVGRYYSMDRDNNWQRTEKAYNLLTLAEGRKANSAEEAIKLAYSLGDPTDYYIKPTAIVDKTNKPIATIDDKDAVIFFNFRTDRPRQLTKAFIYKRFPHFKRKKFPNVLFVGFTLYDKSFSNKMLVAFEEEKIKNNLGEVISRHNLKQLRIAETEKYAHVTYFFNSQRERPYRGEKRILIPSAKVPSYALKPEMSAYEIAEETIRQINSKKFDFILVNFANCDLVGHSANIKAIVKAVKVVDECTAKVAKAALENNYAAVITADHGSAEEKLYANGRPKPAHSTNPVPFIIVSNSPELRKAKLKKKGKLIDVAPTILYIMGLPKPREMEGKVLIEH
ncbi:MAG: 2,3-bisphosphoglycerate-independent phosphoglycerate mutase [Candidatus Diapherotrites archaeon]|nr:2,3-bisphosphoglycerate-independent phosphoglycerate mutase [Candidatus Diapherotrites archaeon]